MTLEVRKETKNLDYIFIVLVRKSHYVSETLSKGSPLLWKKILKRKTLEPCPFRRIARGRNEMFIATLQSSGVMPGSRCDSITHSGGVEERRGFYLYPVVQHMQHNLSDGLRHRQGLCSSIHRHSGAVRCLP